MTDAQTEIGGIEIRDETHGPTRASEDYPPAPNPSADPAVIPFINETEAVQDDRAIPEADFEVDSLDPVMALKILSRGTQALSDMTGDVPATPPISRSNSPRLLEPAGHRRTGSRPTTPPSRVSSSDMLASMMKDMPIGSPESHPSELTAFHAKAALRAQFDAIARKFFSKKAPPVPINDYLLRLQRYCPMSTAVYLAAAAYIHRLAVDDRSVPVTVRTSHRLLLAALRVAMKALEDLNYPHARFAGVGGVSERELVKLELALCYMLNFDLKVNQRILHDKARAFQQLGTAPPRPIGAAFPLKLSARQVMPRQPEPFQAPTG